MHVSQFNNFFLLLLLIWLQIKQSRRRNTNFLLQNIYSLYLYRDYTPMLQPSPVYPHKYVPWSIIKHSFYIINNKNLEIVLRIF